LEAHPHREERDISIKHYLKLGRWRARRFATVVRWRNHNQAEVPAVFGNAMPKSGSHLIIQVLQGLTKIGPFVNPGFPPVNRTEDNQQISDEGILKVLSQMRSGDIGYGYLQAKKIFVQALTRQGMASIFVYRDPRDMIVSHVFYATEIFPDHGMHRYYTESLTTMEERINAAIGGVTKSELKLKSIRARYDVYKDWLAQPEVLCIRFEDLRLEQDNAFNRILDFLEEHGFQVKISRQRAIEMLGEAITPQKSGTFRKGKPGSWREHFTQKNIDFFKQSTGDLLVDLGYENNNEWSIDRF
jgi:hypothetical protein